MIRTFNFTGRKRIARSRIAIELLQEDGAPSRFDASIDLSGMKLPGHARVFVEAYRRSFLMRFPFGTVDRPRPPADRVLRALDPKALVLFRVKVVDYRENGRILAGSDRIVPRRSGEEPADKVCLLPVDFVDLGQLVWRLDLAGDWPSLQLNRQIDNIREIARSDRFFLTLVYPEVVRRILYRIVVEEDHTDPASDPEDWMSQWLAFVMRFKGIGDLPPSGQAEPVRLEKLKWIDEAVEDFCAEHAILERFSEACEGRES